VNRNVGQDQARGIALMTLAMLTIPAVDGLAKYLSSSYSPLFIGWARYAVACAVIVPFAAVRHGRRIFPSERLGAHMLRTVFLMIAMTLYFMSVARIPLATAATASFISPIVAVTLAVVMLKEQLTGRKLLSLALGFGGALVVLRPGGRFEPGVLLALATGVFFAFYYNNLFPEQIFHISRSIEIILGPIIGGVGTLFGPILGAAVLTLLADGITDLLAALGLEFPGVKQVFYGVAMRMACLDALTTGGA